MNLCDELNPVQQEAVEQTEGPVIIFAGAGSGKTRVLTYRIAYLLQQGVSPYQVLAVTFTNRAASEMRQRVAKITGSAGTEVWISTFHSMAVRILRREVRYLPYDQNFVIFDDDDQMTVAKQCVKELDLDDKKYRPRTMLVEIGAAKNNMVEPGEYLSLARDQRNQKVARVYALYQKKLEQQNAMDFDDLLLQTVKLFRDQPEVLQNYQHRFRYLMVDEYQDTNRAQYLIVNLLAGGSRNLCVVGDDDQSIYGWRGADIRNILDFEKDYPEARVIKLEQNYRSTQRILTVANAVISHNRGRKPKSLWTSNSVGEQVCYYQAYDERDEALFVKTTIEGLVRQGETHYREIAIFYRTHAQSRSFEEDFIRHNIPYRIFGGLRFYERKEIRDTLANLRLVANPSDEVALRRVINVPHRGIGDTALGHLTDYARQSGVSLGQALSRVELVPGLASRTVKALQGFATMVECWRSRAQQGVAALTNDILVDTGYRALLVAEHTTESETRLENLKEFLGVAGTYDTESDDRTLAGFLEQLALVTDIDNYQPDDDAVVMMTIHSAKGLEFPVVFITGLEEGIFPHARSIGEEDEMEEERRLCYVGITRAQQRLYLSWASQRFLHGAGSYHEPSRFIAEVPEEFLYPVIPGGAEGNQVAERSVESPKKESAVKKQLPPLTTGRALLEARSAQAQSAAQAAAVAVQPDASYQAGDRVEHKKFGRGVVKSVQSDRGGDLQVSVQFETYGAKVLMANLAPMKKI
jgi:DNA helicase-2/ATP-dependent DNA helicase PcrA